MGEEERERGKERDRKIVLFERLGNYNFLGNEDNIKKGWFYYSHVHIMVFWSAVDCIYDVSLIRL